MRRHGTVDFSLTRNAAPLLGIKGRGVVFEVGQQNIGVSGGVENFGFPFVEFLSSSHRKCLRQGLLMVAPILLLYDAD
jgi:hypothetical protein